MRISALLTALLLAAAPEPEDSLAALRRDIADATRDGLTDSEYRALELRWRALLQRAEGAPEVASTVLCGRMLHRAGPAKLTAALRARAVETLAAAGRDSRRALRMLVADFLPPLDRLPAEHHAEEVAAFDAMLAEAARRYEAPVVRAALAYTSLHLRIEVARSWDAPWLDAAERTRAARALEHLGSTFGDLSHPLGATYAEVAGRGQGELTTAVFGKAMALEGSDLDGNSWNLGDQRGRVVLAVFWSTWCMPCLAAVPDERALVATLAGQPFTFVGVCSDETRAQGRATAERTGMTWPSLHDGGTDGPLAQALGVRAWPSAFVFDADGALRHKFVPTAFRRGWNTDDLHRAVQQLLEETDR